jgi:hypothetical protein
LSNPSPSTNSSSPPSGRNQPEPPAQEFRTYRRFLATAVLGFIVLGSSYLLASVGVGIYRERHPMSRGEPVSTLVTHDELLECWQELSELSLVLQQRFESLHDLLEGDKAQSWAEEVYKWRDGWTALGQRCRFRSGVVAGRPKEFDNMVAAYNEVADMEAVYTKDLLRFGKELAPRLDRLRKQIDSIGLRLEQTPAGEQQR